MSIKQKINTAIGSVGAFLGVFVFVAYIPQILANLHGVSCLIWVLYGFTKEPKRDVILMIPNSVGVVLGLATFLTSL